jgi:pimeloyl-ACP methyl ester carboxylesterase
VRERWVLENRKERILDLAGVPVSSHTTKPGIVFAHGLWADGSCFSRVIGPLQAEGYDCMASGHGLNSLKSDVESVIRCIGRVGSPVVLVGHSYGGTLITHAGVDDRVAALVYLCALAPDDGESSQAQQDKFDRTSVFDCIDIADGRIWLREEGTRYFCGDLSDTDQKLVYATAVAPAQDVFALPYPGVAWKTKPCWYVVGSKDRTVNPELERFVAKRMNAKTTELDSSHVPMLSQPDAVIDVIRDAASSC